MATVFQNDEQLKEAFKTAIVEVLQERKDQYRLGLVFEDDSLILVRFLNRKEI